MTEERLVVLVRLRQLRETSANLGDHEEMRLGLGCDVAERHAKVILVDDVRGDLLGDDLVEERGLARVGHALQVGLEGGGLLVSGAAIARMCVRRGGVTRRTVGVTRGRDATRTADAKARAATLIDQ